MPSEMHPDRVPDSTDLRDAGAILHRESWACVAPIYWLADPHDATSIRHNGTCFFVDTGTAVFGVTAHHVIAKYLEDLKAEPSTELRIRNTRLAGWADRAIDSDPGLDVTTFRMSETEMAEIGVRSTGLSRRERSYAAARRDGFRT